MTNKERFLEAQAVFNRRMSTRRARRGRALAVRVIYVAGLALSLVLVVSTVFPELRHQVSLMVAQVFALFGMEF